MSNARDFGLDYQKACKDARYIAGLHQTHTASFPFSRVIDQHALTIRGKLPGMSELAAAPAAAPAADDDPLKGEPTPESQQDVIRIFNGFKRDAQMIISKVSELEYEIGEHELVVANARELPDDRNAYRLVGGVLVKTTVGDALPKVQQNMANIRATIDKLKVALASVNAKSAAWKEKYGIKTQQEMELEKRNAQASGGAVKAATGVLA